MIVRIEDTDQKRSSDAASIGFLADLSWLGINWDEGPVHEGTGGGPHGPYFQSERLDIYNRCLQQLIDSGHAYYAFETPEELDTKRKAALAEKRAYRYDRAALLLSADQVAAKLAANMPAVVRFKCPGHAVTIHDQVLGDATIPAEEIDDFVIRKADGFPTYHFAVVVDDEFMQVTHVMRAQEHFTNTAKHMLLQDALGFRRPTYAHMSIICNPDGSKMSKRDKDKALRAAVKAKSTAQPQALSAAPIGPDGHPAVAQADWDRWLADKNVQLDFGSAARLAAALGVVLPEINVDDFRRSGYLPEVLCNFIALNGWSPGNDIEKFDNAFLAQHLRLERIQKTAAKFDRVKLLSFNTDAITGMPRESFIARARAHGEQFHAEFMRALPSGAFDRLAAASHERSKTLEDMFAGNAWAVASDDSPSITPDAKTIDKVLRKADPATGLSGLAHLENIAALLRSVPADQWTPEGLEPIITAYANEKAGWQMGKVAQPLRVALTGGTISPPIFDTLCTLPRERTLARLARVIEAAAGAAATAAAAGPTATA